MSIENFDDGDEDGAFQDKAEGSEERQTPARRERHDGFTSKKKRRFLKALGKTGCVLDACRMVGISKTAVYTARERDPHLEKQWDRALRKAGTEIELTAWERGVEGVEEDVIAYGKVVGKRRKYDSRCSTCCCRRRTRRSSAALARPPPRRRPRSRRNSNSRNPMWT